MLLLSLDLSSAFDAVRFHILLSILRKCKKIFVFRNRPEVRQNQPPRQQVIANGWSSREIKNNSGVPQDSILGPVLFVLCLSSVYALLDELNISRQ